MSLFGIGAIGLGAIGLGYAVFRIARTDSNSRSPIERRRAAAAEVLPTDELSPLAPRKEVLQKVTSRQTVTLLGDRERAVVAKMTFFERTESPEGSNNWIRTGNRYHCVSLAGGIHLLVVPSREGGKPVWIRAKEVECWNLRKFFVGENGVPGPARKFRLNKQLEPVSFTLPERYGDATKWELVDVGDFEVTVDGRSENFFSGDGFPFILAREQNGGEKLLLYFDPRKELARGPGGLFIGETFEPEVDVAALL